MSKSNKIIKTVAFSIVSGLAVFGATESWAGGKHTGGHGAKMTIGEAGKAEDAKRTVEVKMFDNYYQPESISIKEGETVRFVVKNEGELVHEFAVGTAAMHAGHQKEMMMMMEHGALEPDKINHQVMNMPMAGGHVMKHNDPNSILLEPGKSGEIIWKFAKAIDIEFACNVPGHYEAGMMGNIRFTGKGAGS